MNIGTPLTEVDFGDPSGLFSLDVSQVLGDEWGEVRDIEIITLKQYLHDKASEDAWRLTNDPDEVDIIIELLLGSKHSYAKEFVPVHRDKFVIGINAPVIRKNAINHAFYLLSLVEELEDYTTIEFGETIEVYESKA